MNVAPTQLKPGIGVFSYIVIYNVIYCDWFIKIFNVN